MSAALTDTLLLIEDEALLGDELARHFRREGWEVARARTIAERDAPARRRAVDRWWCCRT